MLENLHITITLQSTSHRLPSPVVYGYKDADDTDHRLALIFGPNWAEALGTLDLAKPRPSSSKPRVNTPTSVLFPLSTFPMTATRTSSLGQSELLFLTKMSAIALPAQNGSSPWGGVILCKLRTQQSGSICKSISYQAQRVLRCSTDQQETKSCSPADFFADSWAGISRRMVTSALFLSISCRILFKTVANCTVNKIHHALM